METHVPSKKPNLARIVLGHKGLTYDKYKVSIVHGKRIDYQANRITLLLYNTHTFELGDLFMSIIISFYMRKLPSFILICTITNSVQGLHVFIKELDQLVELFSFFSFLNQMKCIEKEDKIHPTEPNRRKPAGEQSLDFSTC
jgi:hypothetical protein